jgi:hypothetical protein
MNTLVQQFYTRDAFYHIRADPWYYTRWRLDLAGSLAIWFGALLYNISCFSLAYKVCLVAFRGLSKGISVAQVSVFLFRGPVRNGLGTMLCAELDYQCSPFPFMQYMFSFCRNAPFIVGNQ